MSAMQPATDGVASQSRTTFRKEVGVGIEIDAAPDRVWSLLTDAEGYKDWNSSIDTIEGRIAEGEKIKLTVPIAPGRTFKLKVSGVVPDQRMMWSDGFFPMFQGQRTYTLEDAGQGKTVFRMVEVFRGLMLPMIAGSLPDFGPAFETFAADLKKAAERD